MLSVTCCWKTCPNVSATTNCCGNIPRKNECHSTIAAKSGSASQTINAIVRGRKVAGLQKHEEIAEACGYEYVDFLLLGRRTLGGAAPATAEGDSPQTVQLSWNEKRTYEESP
jgi:hypothetical protein